jgi:hypothetical protein
MVRDQGPDLAIEIDLLLRRGIEGRDKSREQKKHPGPIHRAFSYSKSPLDKRESRNMARLRQ